MQQLTPMDSVFLSMETPETPGHIGGLSILDPSASEGVDFERFVEFMAGRIPLCARFGWTLQEVPFGLDRPYWIKSGRLDVRKHIVRGALPSPGTSRELAEAAGRLFEVPLRRDRPLWEMHWLEGLQGGRVALLWKVHHALMDGMSGAGLMEVLFDTEPNPEVRRIAELDDEAHAGQPVGMFGMAARGVSNAFERPGALMRHAVRAGSSALDGFRGEGRFATPVAPRTHFNGTVGSRRGVAWTSVSFADVKRLKDALGVKVNDVALAITGGALRRYLEERGELPEESLVASVPVSLRKRGDKTIGNKVGEIAMYWGTDVADPVERVLAVHEASTQAKRSHEKDGVNLLEAMSESLSPNLVGLMTSLAASNTESIPLPGNAVLSNVPLPPIPLYVAGGRVERILPISILAPTQGLNITVVSYCGELHFGLTLDPELVEEPWALADGIAKSLVELQEAAERAGAFHTVEPGA